MGPQFFFGKHGQFLKAFLVLAVLILTDQISKSFIANPILNPGFFMGFFEHSSAFLRVFSTLALLSIVVLLVSLIQFLIWKSEPLIVWALLLTEAGLIGNGIDKLKWGAVRDFISLPNINYHFNVADIYIAIGTASILFLIWKNPGRLWPEDNARNTWLIFPRTQWKLVSVLVVISFLLSFGNWLVFTAYLKSNFITYDSNEVLICTALFFLMTSIVLVFFGILWSHRIFGPIKAISRVPLKLRSSDEVELVKELLVILKK